MFVFNPERCQPPSIGTIIATVGELSDTTGIISVMGGGLCKIIIMDAPDGGGKEVEKWLRSDDGSIKLYCAGYDISGNFIGNIPVFWRVSLDYGNLIISPAESSDSLHVLNKGPALRIDNVLVNHRDLNLQDSTGVLYLVDKSLHSVQIRTASDGQGDELTTVSMTTNDSFSLYAAGYDSSGSFLNNQIVEWYATGSLDILNTTDKALVFNPTTAPTSGSIIATVDDMSDATGTITVNPGELCYIKIRCSSNNSPACFPEYEDTVTVYVDERLSLWFAGFDCDGNYRGDEPVSIDSTDIEYTGTLMVENWIFTERGRGRIIVSGIDTSGVIIFTENPASITTNNIIPSQFKLEQAYPNPFNPSTTIRFYLPKSEHVVLEVYNNIGQEILTLIDQKMNSGEHTVDFNAEYLSSGIYLYRI
jgi:hypothetical protein